MRPIAHRARIIPGEGAIETLGRALALEAQGRSMIHLEVGQPDYPTPPHILEAGIKAMRDGLTRYGPAPGAASLRAAIADHVSATRGIPVDPSGVLVAPGAKPIIYLTIMALIEPGDEVIVPNPGFPAYEAVTLFAGGVPVPLRLRAENNFGVDMDALRACVSDRTRLIILNSPANPTGGALSLAELEEIADLAVTRDLWLLSDEIYRQLYYTETQPPSIASLPGLAERTIVLDGFSKAYAMTGWRLGYGVFPQALVQPVTHMIVNDYTCVPLFVQEAGVTALRGPQDFVAEMRAEYHARRDLVLEGLRSIPGVACTTPGGAFYVIPSIRGLPNVPDERWFANRLLEHGVACLPGTDFGQYGEGHLRLSYAASRDQLAEALRRIRGAVEELSL
jgi:aspartate/methionine/tyrosine aminotransferase